MKRKHDRWLERWIRSTEDLARLQYSHHIVDAVIDEIDGRQIRIGDQWLSWRRACCSPACCSTPWRQPARSRGPRPSNGTSPRRLGRVSSLDWLIPIGLLPVSYALAGPVSSAIGVRNTLIGAGVLGALVTFAPLLIPAVRRVDDDQPATATATATRHHPAKNTPPDALPAWSGSN